MPTNLLLAHFAAIADAPGGVARLRQLILQLAVQGRLVEQDAEDEPASKLLRRANESSIPLDKVGAKGDSSYPLHPIPDRWTWAHFEQVADFRVGKTPPTKEAKYWSDTGASWVSIGDMTSNGTITTTSRKITEIAERDVFKGGISRAGTLLMSFKLTIGKVSVLGVDAYHNEAIISIFPRSGILQAYLLRFLPILAIQGDTKNAIKGSTLNKESISGLLIPIPPLAEQRRIVARVDALMAMCDALEQRQAQQGEGRRRLLGALVGDLLASPVPPAPPVTLSAAKRPDMHPVSLPGPFADAQGDRVGGDIAGAWQRLSDSFDLILAAPEDVAPLRQAILQLAVQGRLVEQDADDEPASKLLERIRQEKARLVREGKNKKVEPSAPVTDKEQPFDVPHGWEWVKLAEICLAITDGDHQPPPKAPSGIPFLVISNVSSGRLNWEEHRSVPQSYYDSLDETKKPTLGDILYTVTGSYGIPVQVDSPQPFCVQRHISIIKPSRLVEQHWLQYALRSNLVFDQATACATGIAQKTVPLGGLRQFKIPLPPLAEQHRIVARVEHLMALCDGLEARLREQRAAAERLSAGLCRAAVGQPAAPVNTPSPKG